MGEWTFSSLLKKLSVGTEEQIIVAAELNNYKNDLNPSHPILEKAQLWRSGPRARVKFFRPWHDIKNEFLTQDISIL